MKITFIFTAIFLLFASFNVKAIIHGLEKPVPKWTCELYSQFAIWSFDKGEGRGSEEIKIRRVSEKMSADALCEKNQDQNDILLKDAFGYFDSAFENIILIKSPNKNGEIGEFSIYEVLSGKKLLDKMPYNTNIMTDPYPNPRVKKVKDKISLSFFKPLKLSCPPTKGNDSCWKKILKENMIPENIKINFPDCQDAIEKIIQLKLYYGENSPYGRTDINKDSFQITTKVQIDDLFNPNEIHYLGGESTCKAVLNF